MSQRTSVHLHGRRACWKWNFFEDMIDQLAPELLYLTFYFQGEPYLNPDFLDMVQYASVKKNIYSHFYQCPLSE